MNGIDDAVAYWIAGIRNPVLDSVMFGITYAVDYLVIALVIFLLLFMRHKRLALGLILALAIELCVTLGMKELIHRPRPTVLPLDVSDFSFYSFPSGHTSRAFVIAGLFSNVWRHQRLLFYSFAVLVGFSRIYLGVHYFTDVVAGAGVGILVSWAVVRFRLMERVVDAHYGLKKKQAARNRAEKRKAKRR